MSRSSPRGSCVSTHHRRTHEHIAVTFPAQSKDQIVSKHNQNKLVVFLPAVVDADIQVHNITILQWPTVRNAVTDDLVHRSAHSKHIQRSTTRIQRQANGRQHTSLTQCQLVKCERGHSSRISERQLAKPIVHIRAAGLGEVVIVERRGIGSARDCLVMDHSINLFCGYARLDHSCGDV